MSDRALKENVRPIPEEELKQTFDAVEPQLYDRIGGGEGTKRLRGPGRAGQREAGCDHVQNEEFGRERAHGPRLPEALRGFVGRSQEAAEAGGEAGEEEEPQERLGLMLHHKETCLAKIDVR